MNPLISAELAALRITELTSRAPRRHPRRGPSPTVFRRSPRRDEGV